jgi:hypothetical protein
MEDRKMKTYWQAETYNQDGEIISFDFPHRQTAEEAIQDAKAALTGDVYAAGAAEFTQTEEEGFCRSTGRGYGVGRRVPVVGF